MKDIFFFVITTVDTNPMGQLGGPTLGTGLGFPGFEFMGGPSHIAPGLGFSFLGNWHLLKNPLKSNS
jgi:hypothetical protein